MPITLTVTEDQRDALYYILEDTLDVYPDVLRDYKNGTEEAESEDVDEMETTIKYAREFWTALAVADREQNGTDNGPAWANDTEVQVPSEERRLTVAVRRVDRWAYRVTCVHVGCSINGREALALVRKAHPDAVVDVVRPIGDGSYAGSSAWIVSLAGH